MAKREKITAFATPLYEACALNKDPRESLQHVFFKDDYAYASDGILIVKQALSESPGIKSPKMLNGCAIHRDIFKKIMAYPHATADIEGIITPDGVTHPYAQGVQRPSFERALGHAGGAHDVGDHLYINPAALSKVVKALNIKHAKMTFYKRGDHEIVEVREGELPFRDQLGLFYLLNRASMTV